MTSIAQIVAELVHRGEESLAEELVELLHPTPEDIEMILSQDDGDKDKDKDKGGDEEPPPADESPMVPDEEGDVSVRIDYPGRRYVIFVTIDKNVLYWNADKKGWVDDELDATKYDTRKKAEKATKKADKSYEKTHEGKEEPPQAPKPPAPPAEPEKPAEEPEKAPEKPEDKGEKKKPIPPQFQKKADDKEAKSQLISHLRDAGYYELAGAIAGDLNPKK
jgi:hypothetical protein